MESISAFSCRVQLRLVLPFASCSPILALFRRRIPRFLFNLRPFGKSGLNNGQHTSDADCAFRQGVRTLEILGKMSLAISL